MLKVGDIHEDVLVGVVVPIGDDPCLDVTTLI